MLGLGEDAGGGEGGGVDGGGGWRGDLGSAAWMGLER